MTGTTDGAREVPLGTEVDVELSHVGGSFLLGPGCRNAT